MADLSIQPNRVRSSSSRQSMDCIITTVGAPHEISGPTFVTGIGKILERSPTPASHLTCQCLPVTLSSFSEKNQGFCDG